MFTTMSQSITPSTSEDEESSVSQMEARLSRKRQTEQIENLELRRDTEKDLVLPVVAEMEDTF